MCLATAVLSKVPGCGIGQLIFCCFCVIICCNFVSSSFLAFSARLLLVEFFLFEGYTCDRGQAPYSEDWLVDIAFGECIPVGWRAVVEF